MLSEHSNTTSLIETTMASFGGLSLGMKIFTVFQSTFLSLTAIVGFVGNCFTIYVVLRNRSLQRVYSYFLVNLAIADIFVNLLNFPLGAISLSYRRWPLSDDTCTFLGLLMILSCTVSVLNLVALAVNRYMAIVRDTHLRNVKQFLPWCMLTWLIGILTILPPLLGFGQFGFNDAILLCVVLHDTDGRLYLLVLVVSYIIIATFIIVCCYSQIYTHVHSPYQEVYGNQNERRNDEKKISWTICFIYLGFLICWGPILIVTVVDKFVVVEKIIVWQLTGFMAVLNSSINPLIYGWKREEFRLAYRRLFGCRSTIPEHDMVGDKPEYEEQF